MEYLVPCFLFFVFFSPPFCYYNWTVPMIVCQYLLRKIMSRDKANHELAHDLNSLEFSAVTMGFDLLLPSHVLYPCFHIFSWLATLLCEILFWELFMNFNASIEATLDLLPKAIFVWCVVLIRLTEANLIGALHTSWFIAQLEHDQFSIQWTDVLITTSVELNLLCDRFFGPNNFKMIVLVESVQSLGRIIIFS